MKKVLIAAVLLVIIGASVAYAVFFRGSDSVKNTAAITQQLEKHFKHDAFPVRGTFHWTFYLGPVKQVSTHIFADNHIDYRMRGKVHSTDYRMNQLSYNADQKRWIGETPEGVVYALFFKTIADDKIVLYKHKCAENGLAECLAMQRPADDETKDHGWNTYTREGIAESQKPLPFSGTFVAQNDTEQVLSISDKKARWQGSSYEKLTHHPGERRWVGQADGKYLVVFYRYEEKSPDFAFAIHRVDDVEPAYQLKYPQQTFTAFDKQ